MKYELMIHGMSEVREVWNTWNCCKSCGTLFCSSESVPLAKDV